MRKIKPLLQEERSKEYNFDKRKTVSTARLILIPESTDAILDQRGSTTERNRLDGITTASGG